MIYICLFVILIIFIFLSKIREGNLSRLTGNIWMSSATDLPGIDTYCDTYCGKNTFGVCKDKIKGNTACQISGIHDSKNQCEAALGGDTCQWVHEWRPCTAECKECTNNQNNPKCQETAAETAARIEAQTVTTPGVSTRTAQLSVYSQIADESTESNGEEAAENIPDILGNSVETRFPIKPLHGCTSDKKCPSGWTIPATNNSVTPQSTMATCACLALAGSIINDQTKVYWKANNCDLSHNCCYDSQCKTNQNTAPSQGATSSSQSAASSSQGAASSSQSAASSTQATSSILTPECGKCINNIQTCVRSGWLSSAYQYNRYCISDDAVQTSAPLDKRHENEALQKQADQINQTWKNLNDKKEELSTELLKLNTEISTVREMLSHVERHLKAATSLEDQRENARAQYFLKDKLKGLLAQKDKLFETQKSFHLELRKIKDINNIIQKILEKIKTTKNQILEKKNGVFIPTSHPNPPSEIKGYLLSLPANQLNSSKATITSQTSFTPGDLISGSPWYTYQNPIKESFRNRI